MGAKVDFRGMLSWRYLRSEKQSGHMEDLAQLCQTQALLGGTILIVIQFGRNISEYS